MGIINVRLEEQVWRVDEAITTELSKHDRWEVFIDAIQSAEAEILDVEGDMEELFWIKTGPSETVESMMRVVMKAAAVALEQP
jgi:hypothetical protein